MNIMSEEKKQNMEHQQQQQKFERQDYTKNNSTEMISQILKTKLCKCLYMMGWISSLPCPYFLETTNGVPWNFAWPPFPYLRRQCVF